MSSEIDKLQQEIDKLHSIISKNQRLWLTGSMMGNLIHDLNNPLTSINGNIELLLINSTVLEDAKLKKRIDTINNATKRLTSKMRDMQLFTKEGRSDILIEVNEVCQETARVAEYLPKTIKLSTTLNLSDKTLTCIGNPNQLAQAILMLLDNALDNALTSPNPKVTLTTALSDKGQVIIKVSDNGPVIPFEVETKMFEPLFSTKGQIGMGLTVVRDAVLAHSGELTYTTSVEETTFTITLPTS
jgi:signal transduction histidine kinase